MQVDSYDAGIPAPLLPPSKSLNNKKNFLFPPRIFTKNHFLP
jgi:hypothetical protein